MDHQRFGQWTPEGATFYIRGFGILAELVVSSTTRWNDYLMVGQTMIGVRTLNSDQTVSVRYFHHDHLGSIAVITNEAGAVVERDSHDAWGKRRQPNGDDDPTGSITSQSTRGFTGEEELAVFGLVHLNGRVYDPLVGRMMSADPLVPDPMNGQAWNRYSYVINNPLAFTDPSGYSWLSEAFHAVQDLFRSVPIIGAIVRIAAVALCGPGASICAFAMAVISSAAVAGITTGKLSAALQAGAVAGLTAAAFYGVGTLTTPPGGIQPFTGAHIANIAGHALVGCASAVAMGGKCGPGALSAAVPSFAGPFIKDIGFEGKLVAHTVLGGVASVAGGGKFENGAVTAAFGYLFNEAAHERTKAEVVRQGVLVGLELLNPHQDQTSNIQSLNDNFARVVDPAAIDTTSWTARFSSHATAIESPPIPDSDFAIKLYQDPTQGNVIAVVYPTNSFMHYLQYPLYLMGAPVNYWNASKFLESRGGGR